MIRIHKKHTTLKKMTKEEDCYVDASLEDRVSLVWEITAEVWSLKNPKDVERRLQRNIANLVKKQG